MDKRQGADSVRAFHVVHDALCAYTWTEEKPEWGPDWHRQFPDWKAALAARIAVEALEEAGLLNAQSNGTGAHEG